MSKILVTGGKGAVGTYLVKELQSRDHDVFVADRAHSNEDNYFRCDISQYRQVEKVLEEGQFDYVYNLAAEFGRWNGEDFYENLWASNAIGTKHVIRMQEKLGFNLVHFSSSEVYGDYDGDMSEDVMDKYEIRQMNDYAMTKWVNEMQIMNSAEMFDTKTVRVRLFNTYGPGEYYSNYRSVICLFCYRALHGLPYTVYQGHTRTSTYITDMATTLSNIVDNFKPSEVYNIAGKDYHTVEEASETIWKVLGKAPQNVTMAEAEPYTTKDKKVTVTKAVEDLNHHPKVTLDEGITNTIAWMKSVYNV